MAADLFINELSLEPGWPSRSAAVPAATGFGELLVAASRTATGSALRCASFLLQAELASGYRFVQWLNDGAVDVELRRAVKSLVTRWPDRSREMRDAIAEAATEYHYEDRPTLGLGYAAFFEGLCVSVARAGRWQSPVAQVTETRLGADATLASQVTDVRHASTDEHLATHAPWLALRRSADITDFGQMLERWPELFPSLDLCDSARKQLVDLPAAEPDLLPLVVFRLRCLDRYFAGQPEGIDERRIECRVQPESPTTLEKYAAERTIACPDGQVRRFMWHTRLTAGRRLYFREHCGRGLVGYIGPHPRNVSND